MLRLLVTKMSQCVYKNTQMEFLSFQIIWGCFYATCKTFILQLLFLVQIWSKYKKNTKTNTLCPWNSKLLCPPINQSLNSSLLKCTSIKQTHYIQYMHICNFVCDWKSRMKLLGREKKLDFLTLLPASNKTHSSQSDTGSGCLWSFI